MDLMPVANQSQDQQHHGNKEQPRGLRGIHSMPLVPARYLLLGLCREHADIVAPDWGLGS
jgi:hypothetical protein